MLQIMELTFSTVNGVVSSDGFCFLRISFCDFWNSGYKMTFYVIFAK